MYKRWSWLGPSASVSQPARQSNLPSSYDLSISLVHLLLPFTTTITLDISPFPRLVVDCRQNTRVHIFIHF
jgi:hypothetical protein